MDGGAGAKPARASARLAASRIAHEMADMVEENLVAERKLAVRSAR